MTHEAPVLVLASFHGLRSPAEHGTFCYMLPWPSSGRTKHIFSVLVKEVSFGFFFVFVFERNVFTVSYSGLLP